MNRLNKKGNELRIIIGFRKQTHWFDVRQSKKNH